MKFERAITEAVDIHTRALEGERWIQMGLDDCD